ncbi:MAG: HAD family hydrolase [Mariprofundaceae bacterium]|nr:HAD family hydrolase [Mariprofundaceae bacterium]
MKPCDAILLDMDGTLVDAFAPIVYALNATLEEYSLPQMSKEAIVRHTGKGECSMMALFGDRRVAAGKRFLEFHDQRMFELSPLPAAEDLLRGLLDAGIARAIVTSKSQQRADQQLKFLQWDGLLDAVVGLCDDRRQKPDPHTLQLACEKISCKYERTWMIGDGIADMQAARRAGLARVMGIANSFSDAELRKAGADETFIDLQGAWTWIQKQIN